MPLPLEGPRPLSPLEREAFRLVFWDSIDPCDVYVTVIEKIEHTVKNAVATYSNGGIKFGRSRFPYTDALNIDSTLANTDIFKPGNMNYLSRLIHEATHHWQSVYKKYDWRGPPDTGVYYFSKKELETLKFIKEEHPDLREPHKFKEEYDELLKEQHASAAQVYFVIAWQLEYSSDRLVNLTMGSDRERRVGPVHRYYEIAAIPTAHPHDPVPPGRWVSRGDAEGLSNHFSAYLVDLRSGGRKQWAG